MPAETPIELEHVAQKLRMEFTGRLPEAISGKPEEREANFLSRALAAYALHKGSGCSLAEAADSIVDGGGDYFIDGIYHNSNTNTLWLVQSKFMTRGRGEPELASVTGFYDGIDNVLKGRFEVFDKNEGWKRKVPIVQQALNSSGLTVRAILVYSGENIVSEDRLRILEKLVHSYNRDDEYFAFFTFNLTTVHDWITGLDRQQGVPRVELTLLYPGRAQRPHDFIYGIIPLKDLFALYRQHGKSLIVANIRNYKGTTDVNKQIINTITTEAELFLYLNNGLTAYCERFEIHNIDRTKTDEKRITAHRFSIINGAQTLGAIAYYFEQNPDADCQGHVFFKLISIRSHPDEKAFADNITRSTNFQNRIQPRDFVTQDELHTRIAATLQLSGIIYHYKIGEDTPKPNTKNFTIDETLTALACLVKQNHCDLCSKIISQRNALWSYDNVGQPDEEPVSRVEQIFRLELSARTVWRAVQTQRIVVKTMDASQKSSKGLRRELFRHGRWILLNVAFLKLRPEQSDRLEVGSDEREKLVASVQQWAEYLWESCEQLGYVPKNTSSDESLLPARTLRAVFGDAGDCKRLRDALLARINKA